MSEAKKYDIPNGTRRATCKGCNAIIYWVKSQNGGNMPVDPDGTPHWATCPEANRFRGNKK